MTKQKQDCSNATFEALQRWRQALSEAICIKNFTISEDGKTFTYEMLPEKEFDCKNCFSFFCFKSLKFDDNQEDETSPDRPNEINNPTGSPDKVEKKIEDKPGQIPLLDNDDWKKAYI